MGHRATRFRIDGVRESRIRIDKKISVVSACCKRRIRKPCHDRYRSLEFFGRFRAVESRDLGVLTISRHLHVYLLKFFFDNLMDGLLISASITRTIAHALRRAHRRPTKRDVILQWFNLTLAAARKRDGCQKQDQKTEFTS